MIGFAMYRQDFIAMLFVHSALETRSSLSRFFYAAGDAHLMQREELIAMLHDSPLSDLAKHVLTLAASDSED